MTVDSRWLAIISDLFVNLAAGWLAAAMIVSPYSQMRRRVRWWVLTGNILFATISLVVAYIFKILSGV